MTIEPGLESASQPEKEAETVAPINKLPLQSLHQLLSLLLRSIHSQFPHNPPKPNKSDSEQNPSKINSFTQCSTRSSLSVIANSQGI